MGQQQERLQHFAGCTALLSVAAFYYKDRQQDRLQSGPVTRASEEAFPMGAALTLRVQAAPARFEDSAASLNIQGSYVWSLQSLSPLEKDWRLQL